MALQANILNSDIDRFLAEDGFDRYAQYWKSLPTEAITCQLKIKSACVIAGMPWALAVFCRLDETFKKSDDFKRLEEQEGRRVSAPETISFKLSLAAALSAERVALNLLQHASAVATLTSQMVSRARNANIKILDTRKTTPGLRLLEKYAVTVGGGYNHRWGQSDMWMIKDNHKALLGGVRGAVEHFRNLGVFYQPILLEVHKIEELREGLEMGIVHFMLDNFSPSDVAAAVKLKKPAVTFEISGGVTLENIESYLQPGIDAISVGALTQNPARVDMSLKMDIKP